MSRNSAITTDGLISALTSKPEGLLLLAAGVALMLRSGSDSGASSRSSASRGTGSGGNRGARRRQTARTRDNSDDVSDRNVGEGMSEGMSQGMSQVSGTARDAAGKAREYVSDIADRTVETAGAYASSVSDYAERARRGVVDSSGQVAETLQQTVQRVVREQPLSVALVGLAAGAAVAAAFPVTEAEGRIFGPANEKLADAAGRAGEQFKSAGAKASERLAEVAEERGLNPEGLKEAARDVAEAFNGALSGEKDQTKSPGASSGAKPSSGSSSNSSGSAPPVSLGP